MGAQVSQPPHGDNDVWTPKAYSILPWACHQSGGGGVVAARFPIPPPRGGDDHKKLGVLLSMFGQRF